MFKKKRIYFDNAASMPVCKEVIKAVKPFMTKHYGNPSSSHTEGRIAREAIENARKTIAEILHCSSDEIFFTSGASESNSIIMKSGGNTFTTKNNHDSIELGVSTNKKSKINRYAFPAINNETGESGCSRYIGDFNWVHVDLTQYIGKRPLDLSGFDNYISTASFSGHKFGGLKGTGVLFIRKEFQDKIKPLIYGHQENGMRGGTENVIGIVAMAKALEISNKNRNDKLLNIILVTDYIYNTIFEEFLKENKISRITSNNGIINITFKNLSASSAVTIFDNLGVAISAGSACNTGSDEPSKVLINSGYTKDEALRTIRISISYQNTLKEAKKFCKIFKNVIDNYEDL